jgi:hypothetical protein
MYLETLCRVMRCPLLLASALSLVVGAGCVLDNESAPDGAVYDVPDAGKVPEFRDAGCPGGGTSGTSGQIFAASGTSGTGCSRDGGTTTSPTVDAAPPPDATPCDYVTFSYTDASATSVWVTGDWTSWADSPSGGAWQMTKGAGGVWTRSGQIGSGRHLYKLIIDGTTWIADPGASDSEPDGFGGDNSVIEVCAD